ncbi:MAG: efflux RND transporter periplasmic adaptor subunit [Bacteroidota bacterium]|nr:efflux RND transporter periplasmic adaptor subunit [Bacteroidota bacterium]
MKFLYIASILALAACTSPEEPVEVSEGTPSAAASADHIHPTPDQLKAIEPEVGSLQKVFMGRGFTCSGMVDVPPQSLASVTLPFGGFVAEVRLYEGDKVKKGQVIAKIQHPDYMDLQQNYLEALSLEKRQSAELERQANLAREDATSARLVEMATADLSATKARVQSLEGKLRLAGIDPQSVVKNGILTQIPVMAPISGYIASVNTNLGDYVAPNEMIYRIVNPDHLHLELEIFPKDLPGLEIGQSIEFALSGSDQWYGGHIKLISETVDENKRSVKVHAHPDREDLDFLKPGMFIQARVMIKADTVLALPEEAIWKDQDHWYALIAVEDGFQRIEVEPGLREGGMVELRNARDLQYIIRNAYGLRGLFDDEEVDGHGH